MMGTLLLASKLWEGKGDPEEGNDRAAWSSWWHKAGLGTNVNSGSLVPW